MLIKKLFINLENVKIVSKNLQNNNFIKYKFNEFVFTFDKTENISVVGEKIKIYQKYLNEKNLDEWLDSELQAQTSDGENRWGHSVFAWWLSYHSLNLNDAGKWRQLSKGVAGIKFEPDQGASLGCLKRTPPC